MRKAEYANGRGRKNSGRVRQNMTGCESMHDMPMIVEGRICHEDMPVGEAGRTCQWQRQAVQAEFLHRHDIQYRSDS
jgi:hypothetical protein